MSRGFGDCKDLATALVALLRASGTPAHVALIASERENLTEGAVGLTAFDHAIVYVAAKKPFFVDATIPEFASAVSPASLGGRTALVADDARADPLVRVPEAEAAQHGYDVVRDVRLAEIDYGTLETATVYRGAFTSYTSWKGPSVTPAMVEKGAGELVDTLYACSKLDEHKVQGDGSQPLSIRFKASECARILTGDGEATVQVELRGPLNDAPELLLGEKDNDDVVRPERKRALRWGTPFTATYVYRVHPPIGFRPTLAAQTREFRFGPGKLVRDVKIDAKGLVTITARFDSGPRTYTAAQVKEFRQAVDASSEELPVAVTFEQVATAEIAAGREREGLLEFRRVIAAHPKEALHRIQYASALVSMGFGTEARRQAKLAVDLEPSWPGGHRVHGWILQHDELGRHLAPGMDRELAHAELRRASELDRTDASNLRIFGTALLYGKYGDLYGASAKFSEAVLAFKEARKLAPDDTQALPKDESPGFADVGHLARARLKLLTPTLVTQPAPP